MAFLVGYPAEVFPPLMTRPQIYSYTQRPLAVAEYPFVNLTGLLASSPRYPQLRALRDDGSRLRALCGPGAPVSVAPYAPLGALAWRVPGDAWDPAVR